MHSALRHTGRGPVAAFITLEASAWRMLNGQHVLLALIAGVTWLALVGGIMGASILIESPGAPGGQHVVTFFEAHNTGELVNTSFGAVSVTRTDLTPVDDGLKVHVVMRVDNSLDSQIDAPRLESFRVLDTRGLEVNQGPARWNGPSVIIARSSTTVDLTFVVGSDAGSLWLEYRDPLGHWPFRVDLGSASVVRPRAG